jgi:hypothetical protein
MFAGFLVLFFSHYSVGPYFDEKLNDLEGWSLKASGSLVFAGIYFIERNKVHFFTGYLENKYGLMYYFLLSLPVLLTVLFLIKAIKNFVEVFKWKRRYAKQQQELKKALKENKVKQEKELRVLRKVSSDKDDLIMVDLDQERA